MAKIHSRIPEQNIQRGERVVFEAMAALPADWVVFHSCKEDYLEDEHHYIHYEADFVVLVPQKGIAVIEVKDWPQVRLHEGRWQSRKNEQSQWKTHTQSPLEQANIALQKIMRSLARCSCLPQNSQRWPEHRHMAILTQGVPDAGENHNLPFGSLYLCGVSRLKQLQNHIESLFVLNQPERMSAHRVQKITEALAPSVMFHMSLDNYLQEMDSTTANILNILPALYESTGGIRVEGCAGSGKTVIACAEAARQAAELPRDGQHRLLMLCFNHAMAHELMQHPLLPEHGDVLQVCTFHDYCIQQILEPQGFGHMVNYTGAGDRLPDIALEQIMHLLPGMPRYDAIFVDEAQDFRGIWWEIIRQLLKPKGKLYIFADKHQDLYDRYDQLPELPTHVRLNANLRNAHQIADFSRSLLPAEAQNMMILPLSGDDIHLSTPADTPQERAAEVTRIIQELLQSNPGIQQRDIVVLSPWRTAHPRCSLKFIPGLAPAAPDERPEQADARRDACRSQDASHIFASTIKSFKGQEAAYVIVTDVIGLGESRGFDMKELYTACTRARYGLFIVPSTSGHALVSSFIPSSGS